MFPFPNMLIGLQARGFIGSAQFNSSSTVAAPTGTLPGDLLFVIAGSSGGSSVSGNAATWNALAAAAQSAAYWGVATGTGSITVLIGGSGQGGQLLVFRGPVSAAKQTSASGTGSITASGFTKNAASVGIITSCTLAATSSATLTSPGGFQAVPTAAFSTTVAAAYLNDATQYTNGTSFAWTNGSAVGTDVVSYELT